MLNQETYHLVTTFGIFNMHKKKRLKKSVDQQMFSILLPSTASDVASNAVWPSESTAFTLALYWISNSTNFSFPKWNKTNYLDVLVHLIFEIPILAAAMRAVVPFSFAAFTFTPFLRSGSTIFSRPNPRREGSFRKKESSYQIGSVFYFLKIVSRDAMCY